MKTQKSMISPLVFSILFDLWNIIFPILESWKANPDFYTYLTKLGGYNVEQLSK